MGWELRAALLGTFAVDNLGLLRLTPLFRRYLWGGRRLQTILDKPIGDGDDYAESWEVVDHGEDQSLVAWGPLQGTPLRELVLRNRQALLGRHASLAQFPLLFKFLDAHQRLSVQVHPNDHQATVLQPPDLGKTEAWVILHAEPGSQIFAGLKPGVDRGVFQEALRRGTTVECLHCFQPQQGDCVFIPAGTVHALGEGLLVAEIQQASNMTFRLFDWNRVGSDGQSRPLHIEQGLAVIDFARGPVLPRVPQSLDGQRVVRLIACDKFIMDRWQFRGGICVGGDQRFHLLAVLLGAVDLEGDPANRPLRTGETILLPAAAGQVRMQSVGDACLLDIFLP